MQTPFLSKLVNGSVFLHSFHDGNFLRNSSLINYGEKTFKTLGNSLRHELDNSFGFSTASWIGILKLDDLVKI